MAWHGLGLALWKKADERADFEKVLLAFQEASIRKPDFAPARFRLASLYCFLSQYPEALIEADAAVKLMPRSYESYKLRGEAWSQLGRLSRMEDDYKQAIELRPNDAALYREFAGAYSNLGDYEKAIANYKISIGISPDDWMTNHNLGLCYYNAGDCSNAIRTLEEVLKELSTWSRSETDVERIEKPIQ